MKRNHEDAGTATMNHRRNARDEQHEPSAADKEMMVKAEAAGRPGPGHKVLDHYVGDWKGEVKCWMEPGGDPQVSHATARIRWIMNGRFLEEDFQGEMMGQPFQGRTVTGYDNVTQTFKSVWISDMQTSMFVTTGKGGGKVITLEGMASCPMRQRGDIPMKLVLRVLGPDKHTFEMFDLSQGQDTKTMEIIYTRQ
jgi:hypothetical protein